MIKSMRQGVFFDQKYWTRRSKNGRALKPIYFSSLIVGDTFRARTLNHRVRVSIGDRARLTGITRSDGQDTAAMNPAGEVDTESDCESDFAGTKESTSAFGQDDNGERDEQVRAVLIPGSFAT